METPQESQPKDSGPELLENDCLCFSFPLPDKKVTLFPVYLRSVCGTKSPAISQLFNYLIKLIKLIT